MKSLNKKIKLIRQKLKLTEREVDRRTAAIAKREHDRAYHVNRGRVYQIEHGSIPGFAKLMALAEVYGVDPKELQRIVQGGR